MLLLKLKIFYTKTLNDNLSLSKNSSVFISLHFHLFPLVFIYPQNLSLPLDKKRLTKWYFLISDKKTPFVICYFAILSAGVLISKLFLVGLYAGKARTLMTSRKFGQSFNCHAFKDRNSIYERFNTVKSTFSLLICLGLAVVQNIPHLFFWQLRHVAAQPLFLTTVIDCKFLLLFR